MHNMHERPWSQVDLNLMIVLQALLRERQVTRAALAVGLSQSATSHALSRLRELFGDPLLVRSGNRLDLTPRATSLLPELERGLAHLGAALAGEAAFDPASAERRFTVAIADYGQALLLGPLLRRLGSEAPRVELTAISLPSAVEPIDSGAVDMGVVASGPLPPGFSARELFDDGFVCCVRKRHPSVRGPRIKLEQYLALGHVLVAPSGTRGSVVDTELERRGHVRRIAIRISSFLLAPLIVSQSDLVSTGPERLLGRLAPHYPIRIVEPPLKLPRFKLWLVWHSRRDHDPAHAWLRALIERASTEI